MQGWITLHRIIKDHWIWNNPRYFHAWVAILMEVNHKDKKVPYGTQMTMCKRGDAIRSYEQWALIFGKDWTISTVRTFFKLLKNDTMIDLKPAIKATHLTVINYDTYQNQSQANDSEMTSRSQGDDKEIAQNNNDNNDPTMMNNANKHDESPSGDLFGPTTADSIDKIEASYGTYDLKRLGAQNLKNDLAYWNQLVADHGQERVAEALQSIKAGNRWPNQIDAWLEDNQIEQPTSRKLSPEEAERINKQLDERATR